MTAEPSLTRRGMWRRPVLRTDEDRGRPRTVSWLELFVDLAFVVVVSRIAEHLARETAGERLDVGALVVFVVEFLAVFWVWNAFTYYTERFESDGVDQRLLGFAAVVPVAGLAVFGADGLGAGFLGFALSYVLARVLNIACWVRAAVHTPVFRPVAIRFVAGFVVAVALIVVGSVLGPPWGVVLFAMAVLIEIGTPSTTVRHQTALPALSTSRFPERFGQFTIIVLGEAVLETITALGDLSEHHELGADAVALGLLGLGVSFALCWLYFDFVARRPARPTFAAGLLWVYLHLSVLIGITLTGVGLAGAIGATPAGEPGPGTRAMLVGGVVLALVAISSLQPTLTPDAASPGSSVSVLLLLGTAVVLALVGLFLPVGAVTLVAALVVGLAVPVIHGTRRIVDTPVGSGLPDR